MSNKPDEIALEIARKFIPVEETKRLAQLQVEIIGAMRVAALGMLSDGPKPKECTRCGGDILTGCSSCGEAEFYTDPPTCKEALQVGEVQGDGLPPLPESRFVTDRHSGTSFASYTTEQMQDYARAALAARQQVGQEPVVCLHRDQKITDEQWIALIDGMSPLGAGRVANWLAHGMSCIRKPDGVRLERRDYAARGVCLFIKMDGEQSEIPVMASSPQCLIWHRWWNHTDEVRMGEVRPKGEGWQAFYPSAPPAQAVGHGSVDWASVANEYADAACNALDGMKCIRDGLMSVEQVIESQQANIKRIQKMHHRDPYPAAKTDHPYRRITGVKGIGDAADYLARHPDDEYAKRRLSERVAEFCQKNGLSPAQTVDLGQLSTLLGSARTYLSQGLNSQSMNLLGDALALIDGGKAVRS